MYLIVLLEYDDEMTAAVAPASGKEVDGILFMLFRVYQCLAPSEAPACRT